jgi:hypothetical protein
MTNDLIQKFISALQNQIDEFMTRKNEREGNLLLFHDDHRIGFGALLERESLWRPVHSPKKSSSYELTLALDLRLLFFKLTLSQKKNVGI